MTTIQCWRLTTVIAFLVFSAASASAQTTLFTTVEDFTGWENAVPQDSVDLDGSSTNGLAEGGGMGTPGSLAILPSSGWTTHFSDGQQDNAALIEALGSSGEIAFDHDFPEQLQAAAWFQLGIAWNYNGYWNAVVGTTADNMDGTYTTTVPYTFPGLPEEGAYLQIGIHYNSELSGIPVTVDNVRVQNVVPEPASMGLGLLGLAAVGLFWRSRR